MWKCTGLLAVALQVAFGAVLLADEKQEPKGAGLPTFKVPKGWEKVEPDKLGIVAARFRAGEGEKQVGVTLTRGGGSLAANVNRWRGQLGLKALADEDAVKAVQPIKIDGLPAHLFDLTGPEIEGKGKQRIVAVLVPQGELTWFIRMSGPAAGVADQKAAFDEFVKSFRFEK